MRSKIKKIKNKNIMKNERKYNMKATKRIATLALAMLLIFALSVTAFATPNDGKGGTITVTGAVLQDTTQYTVYTVYRMFDVIDGKTAEENKYKATNEWINFVVDPADSTKPHPDLVPYFELQKTDEGTYMIWNKNTTSTADAAAIAQLARKYAESTSGLVSAGTVTVNGTALDLEENGYYLLVPNNNTASGVVVVKGDQNEQITEKSVAPGMPTLEKKVYEDSLQTYVDSNTVGVGEIITYKVTITAGQGASNYILHDNVDEHIEIDYDSGSITRGGNEVAADEYDVVRNPGDGCTFHVEFDETWCNGLNDGAVIVLTYKGWLKDDCETDTPHENTAWLTHTSQNVRTDDDKVSTQTFEVNVKKVDQNGEPLEGAGFILRDNENKYYHYENGAVTWGSKEDATEYFSDANGMLRFYGVDAEIMYLEESSVPGGYTGVDDTLVNTKNGSIKAGMTNEFIKIVNALGKPLPETGGIGTTVFYIGGAVLVVCALCALVVIKRKGTSAQ